MKSRVNVSSVFFVVLGGMAGCLTALLASFFLDFVVTSYSTSCALTYTDWLFVTVPSFSLIGALFNLASAIFLYDEETVKPKKRYKRKTSKK